MNLLLIGVHVIVCFVLIIVILLQAGRGQGLTGSNFGGNVQSLLGTKASSFLTKATSICAILFLFTCIGLNLIEIQKSRSLYQAPQSKVPLDVNQIKKALEKIQKSEAAKSAATEATDAAKSATAAGAQSVPAATASTSPTQAATSKAEAPKP